MNNIKFKILLATILLSAFGLGLVACADKGELSDGFADGKKAELARFHEKGWKTRYVHGVSFIGDPERCAACHGDDYRGGFAGISCEQCHPGWREKCNFCHGDGPGNDTAAPPPAPYGEDNFAARSVGAHSAHVLKSPAGPGFDCNYCHDVPETLFAPNHLEDSENDVRFRDFYLFQNAEYYSGSGSCASVYCHSDGRGGYPDPVSWTAAGSPNCDFCHGDQTNIRNLSGRHDDHLIGGELDCLACHPTSIEEDKNLTDPEFHLNGAVDLTLIDKGVYDSDSGTCSANDCHGVKLRWGR